MSFCSPVDAERWAAYCTKDGDTVTLLGTLADTLSVAGAA